MCSVVTILVTEAEEILERLDQAERVVTTQRDRGMATIRVETFEFIGSQLVPRATRLLRERVQVQVEVEVVEAEPTEAVELLRAGELNAGLIYDSADDPAFVTPELDVTVLLEEPYQVLMARDSPFAVGSEVDLRALADADWICSRDESEPSDRVLQVRSRGSSRDPGPRPSQDVLRREAKRNVRTIAVDTSAKSGDADQPFTQAGGVRASSARISTGRPHRRPHWRSGPFVAPASRQRSMPSRTRSSPASNSAPKS